MNLPKDYIQDLLKELVEHRDWLGERKKKVTQIITDKLHSYEILSIFKGNLEAQKDFLTEDVISSFITTYSNHDIDNEQNIRNKTDLLLDFKEIITPKTLQIIIRKMRDLLDAENKKPYRKEKENLLTCIDDIFSTFQGMVENIPDVNALNAFVDTLILGINAIKDLQQRKIFIFTCLILIYKCVNPQKQNLNNIINDFFTRGDVESVKFVLDKLDRQMKKELINKYQVVFKQRFLQQQPMLHLLYQLTSKDIRTQWLIDLINSEHKRALAKIKELNYKVDNRKNIVDALLKRVKQVPVQEQYDFYDAVNEMECANDTGLIREFASQIKSHLTSDDPSAQKVGYLAFKGATYFTDAIKREITRETVEWLRMPKNSQINKIYSINIVTMNWNILEDSVQKDVVDFIFDKIIKRGINTDIIHDGFEVLSRIKVKYQDYPTCFNDTFERAKTEGNVQIKSEIIQGLYDLRPTSLNKMNRDFWKNVEKFRESILNGGKIIFEDNFENGLKSWSIKSGNPIIENTIGNPPPCLRLDKMVNNNSFIYIKDISNFRNGIIECDVFLEQNSLVNVVFRANIEKDIYYMARLDSRKRGDYDSFLIKKENETWNHIGEYGDITPSGVWHKMRIEIEENTMRLYRDGKVIATVKDELLKEGQIGIFNEVGSVYIDNFIVTSS